MDVALRVGEESGDVTPVLFGGFRDRLHAPVDEVGEPGAHVVRSRAFEVQLHRLATAGITERRVVVRVRSHARPPEDRESHAGRGQGDVVGFAHGDLEPEGFLVERSHGGHVVGQQGDAFEDDGRAGALLVHVSTVAGTSDNPGVPQLPAPIAGR